MPLNKSWHDYNKSLIERGSTHVTVLAFLKIGFKIPYRMVQGIVRGLSGYVRIVEEIHFQIL
jgi:hypothetical protein